MSTYVIAAEIPTGMDALGRVTEWQPMRGAFATLTEYHEGVAWVDANNGHIVSIDAL